ncbi:MAG: sensor histidine kinase [Anaerolineales bacterium]|jgi:predicted ribosomally synthesized peptide with SipW-like signal peptide
MYNSLRFRLLSITIIVLVVAVGTMAYFASQSTSTEFRRSLQGILDYPNLNIDARINTINKLLASKGGERDIWEELQATLEGMARTTKARYVIADLNGEVIADSTGELIGEVINTSLSKPFAAFLIEKKPMLAYIVPLENYNLASIESQFNASVNRSLIIAIALAGLAGLLLTYFLSRSILRPVDELISAARAMEKGDLSQRVTVSTRGELGELAHAFNAMAEGLTRLEQLRQNMVTDVAHELRTPLSNVSGYLEALRDGVVKPTPETIASVYEEAMLLNRLVDDLQELALAEAGQLKLVCQPVNIQQVINKAVQSLRTQALEKEIILITDIQDNLPLVSADAERMGQVLRNLLKNAIINTPVGGEIRIQAQVSDSKVEVSVQDNGMGISSEHLPYVFERFYRVDQSRARETGGAGLGLAIVKQLVEAQGGQVGIDSQVDHGTRITFTSPIAETSA